MKRERRPRPPIPLAVRIAVIERQVKAAAGAIADNHHIRGQKRLNALLRLLFGDEWKRAECDHRPPLGLREYVDNHSIDIAGRYTPNANDPEYLEYILDDEHLERTAGKGGDKMRFGGDVRAMTKGRKLRQRPDLWRVQEHGQPALKKSRKKTEKKASRSAWPKGRKIQSRGFDRKKP